MRHIARRAAGVTGSVTLAIDAKAKEMKKNGIDVVGFGAGEPDFNTPKHIIDAAKAAMDAGQTRYTPAAGTLALRQCIAEKLKRRNNLDYKPTQIIVSNGAKHSLHNAFCAILEEGDEVIVPTPYWVSYPELIQMAGGVPVFVEGKAENGFNLKPEEIEKAITEKTQALVLNTPSNPCGNVYSEAELRAIADIAVKHDIYVIADEIYEDLIYGIEPAPSIASFNDAIKERTIVINGVSKTYAMTGWRIGYLACEERLAKVIANWQSHATSNPNSIAQAAAQAAIEGDQSCVCEMVKEFGRRREEMIRRIDKMPGVSCVASKGAFYIMMDISQLYGKKYEDTRIDDCETFASVLLEKFAVAVVPGSGFGAPNYVRMSYALGFETMVKGLERIEDFIGRLE